MKKRIFLIGGFNKTRFLANSLIGQGFSVTAINNNKEHCIALAANEKLNVFRGDGSQPFVLEDANAYDADIAIALTERDDDNLVICQLCKKKFNVKKTVALVGDPKKIEFFHHLGIDSVVNAVSTISAVIERQAFLDEIAMLVPIGDGRIKILEVHITSNSPVVNKKVYETNLPNQVIIGCIMRGRESMIPRGDTRILTGDVLVVLSLDEHETEAVHVLTGR